MALVAACLLLGVWLPARALAQGAPPGGQPLPPGGQLPELAELLNREGTYVASRARTEVPVAAEERLQQDITRAEFRGVRLRFAVLDQVPRGYQDLNDFAEALASTMRLRNGVLVVGAPGTVAARSDLVPAADTAALLEPAQAALPRDGLVAGMEAAADAMVGRAAEAVVPEARGAAPGGPTATVSAPRAGGEGPWLFLPGLALLGAGVALYGWTTGRRWQRVLGALESARAAASQLVRESQAPQSVVENVERRLVIGERALADLRTVPWWQTWLWPWVPQPRLALAERAFSESLRLLGSPDASPLANHAGADLELAGTDTGALTALDGPSAPAPTPDEPRAPTPGAAAPEARVPGPPPAATPADDRTLEVPPAPPAPSAPPEARRAASGAWWQRRQPADEAEPAASLAPENVLKGLAPQQPVGCFFCGHPLGPRDAEVVTVALAGLPVRPLVCHRHARALAAGERPGVRARRVGEQDLPWFHDPEFRPAWDYDPTADGVTVPWDALPSPDQLLEPAPPVIVHADDSRWPALSERA